MPRISLPYLQHRQTTESHTRRRDQTQESQKSHDERTRRLASQPGLHANNWNKQNATLAVVQLMSVLSSVHSSNTTPSISTRRAEGLSGENRLRYADTLHHWRRIEQAVRRETNKRNDQKTETRTEKDFPLRPDPYPERPPQKTNSFKTNSKSDDGRLSQVKNVGNVPFKPELNLATNCPNKDSACASEMTTRENQYEPGNKPYGSRNIRNAKNSIENRDNNPVFINYDFNRLIGEKQKFYYLTNEENSNNNSNNKTSAINDFFEYYDLKYPNLKTLAKNVLKEKIKNKFHIDINPDEYSFMRFESVMYEGNKKIQYAPAVENKTLTEWLFTNFDSHTQNNLQDIDAMSGIYNNLIKNNIEFLSSDSLNIRPSDFIQLVWDIDFYNYAKKHLTNSLNDKSIHIKRYFIDMMNHLHHSNIEKNSIEDVLTGIGLIKGNKAYAYLFDINGYSAANAFVFKNINGRITLYFPKSEFKFISFKNDVEMRSWISASCTEKRFENMISSHFTIANRQDGTFYYGIDAWLNSFDKKNDYKNNICINSKKINNNIFFEFQFNEIKNKILSDLDSLIKSDSEIIRDMWEEMIDASNIIPNPISPFLSLGIHIEHAIDADTYTEKMQEWGNIKSDIANIISMIVANKISKFPDIEGYSLIKEVKNELNIKFIKTNKKTSTSLFKQNNNQNSIFSRPRIGRNFPNLKSPPAWLKKRYIISNKPSAEGIIFRDPADPERLIKFYKKENSKKLAHHNAESFKRLYKNDTVKIIKLNDIEGKNFFSVNMPKIKGFSLFDIRNNKYKKISISAVNEILKNDVVGKLIANLQDANINANDLNIGNTIFDISSKDFNLIDFDYAEIAYPVTDSHYKTMYQSLHTKIKQDFLYPLLIQFSDKPKRLKLIRNSIKKMDSRFNVLIMNHGKPRLSGFRTAIEKYNARSQGKTPETRVR